MGPEGPRRLRLPGFSDSRYMQVVGLSALRTGRLYVPERSLVSISVRCSVDLRAIVRSERLSQ